MLIYFAVRMPLTFTVLKLLTVSKAAYRCPLIEEIVIACALKNPVKIVPDDRVPVLMAEQVTLPPVMELVARVLTLREEKIP